MMSGAPAPTLPGYTLRRPIAAGGMAEVFVATQHSLGRDVAVKIMKAGDAVSAERFLREARLVAALNHPHIVHIYDVGCLDDGRPYLSMELLAEGDLRHRLRAGLSATDIRRILRQLAEGLVVVHRQGIVHRDIKPANILFRSNGDAVLSDFGIAKAAEVDSELTQAGTVVGSPAYSSPEQVSANVIDARSDLYSLGVVLVEMLTGSNPFRGGDYGSTVVNQLQMLPPRLPAAQQHWQKILDRLLAKKPDDRYADASSLLADLVPSSGQDAAEDSVTEAPASRGNAALLADMDATQVHSVLTTSTTRAFWQDRRFRIGAIVLVLLFALVGIWYSSERDAQLAGWLAQAEERLERDQLSNPPGDNAVFYYRLVLKRDAENRHATAGLGRVAQRYAQLAREARDTDDFDLALDYVARGLDVQADDPELLALSDEIHAQSRARRKKGVQKFFDNLLGR